MKTGLYKMNRMVSRPSRMVLILLCTYILLPVSLNCLGQLDPPKIDTIIQPTCLIETGAVVLSGLPAKKLWTVTAVPGDIKVTGIGTSTTIKGLKPETYTFTVSTKDATSKPSEPVTIKPHPVTPPAPTGPSDQDFCSSPVPRVSLLNATGTGILWYLEPVGGEAQPPTTILTTGNYFASQTVEGCESTERLKVEVTIIDPPSIDAGNGGEECDLDFKLSASSDTEKGTWTMLSGPGKAVFTPDDHDPAALVTVDKYGEYTFAWTVVSGPCQSADIVTVVFHEPPAVSAGDDTIICKGESVHLQGKGEGTFHWEPSEMVSDPGIPDPVATPYITTLFKLTLADQYGCVNSDETEIAVWERPSAYAGSDQVLEYQFSTRMNGSEPQSNERGLWSLLSGWGRLSDPEQARTLVTDLFVGENKYKWTVTNGVCPPAFDTMKITVKDLVIPTLITPNGDNFNEYFKLRGIETLGKTEIAIFDRRGAVVYKNGNYNNEWNGIDYNGNPLPDDTYFFILESESGRSFSGYVVIRR